MNSRKTELVVGGLLLAAFWAFAAYIVVGHILIILYLIAALRLRISSKQVVRVAMATLALAFVGLAAGMTQMAAAFSAYTFLLFIAAVVVLGKELWRQSVDVRQSQKEEHAHKKGLASRQSRRESVRP